MSDSLWNEALDVRGEIYPCTAINVRKILKLVNMSQALVDHSSSVDLVRVSAEKADCKILMIERVDGPNALSLTETGVCT
jgi:hypothetical protein